MRLTVCCIDRSTRSSHDADPRPDDAAAERAHVNPGIWAEEWLDVPVDHIPDVGILPQVAYQIVHDEAMLDGNARLNLATFVTTWMDSFADKLYAEAYDKNMIDKDEYPATAAIEAKCARMMAHLWNAPDETIGVSTIGSSEACMMGGLAFLKRWKAARKAAGKSADSPNMVMARPCRWCGSGSAGIGMWNCGPLMSRSTSPI